MTKVTITISDLDGGVDVEGSNDNPNAGQEPPTPALIVGAFIGAHIEEIVKAANRWAYAVAGEPGDTDEAPRLLA